MFIQTINEKIAAQREWGIAAFRIIIGTVFVLHGYQKLFVYTLPGVSGVMEQLGIPFPMVSAVLATAAEFIGGMALILGLGVRFAAIPMAFTMIVAMATAHRTGFFLPDGKEYVLTLFGALVALFFTGAGRLSVDGWLADRFANEVDDEERTVKAVPAVA